MLQCDILWRKSDIRLPFTLDYKAKNPRAQIVKKTWPK